MPKGNPTGVKRLCDHCGRQFRVKASEVRRGGGKYCSPACYHTSSRVPVDRQLLNHLAASGECLLWTGKANIQGYGQLGDARGGRRRVVLAHRLAFEVAHGQIPAGMQVLHRCDVRRCVNPLHLFLGTIADNMADKVTKGRQSRGEGRPDAKLTDEQVMAVRARHAAGGVSQRQLADEYGVSQSVISAVVRRKRWKHVPH